MANSDSLQQAATTSIPLQRVDRVWAVRFPSLDSPDALTRRRAALLYGGLLVLLAAVLRFAGMVNEPFWHDEVTMLNIGLGGWEEVLRQFEGGRPPVFVVIAAVWTQVFGTGEVVSRIPSLIAGIATVVVFFELGTRLFNQRIGILAALVLTVTEFHIYYAHTYRYYSVYVLMIVLSYLFFYTMLKRGRWWDIALYILFTALAIYTHAHGVFALAAQGVFFLLMLVLRRDYRARAVVTRSLSSFVLLGVLILPAVWLYFLGDVLSTSALFANAGVEVVGDGVGLGWLQEPTVGSIVRALVRFLFFEWYYLNPYGVFIALLFIVIGVVYFIARQGVGRWGRSVTHVGRDAGHDLPDRLPEALLVVTWFLGMLMLPWVLSFITTPMFFDRYVLGASPAYYLLIVVALFALRRVIPMVVVMGAFLVALVPGLIAYYAYPDNERWNDLGAYVSANEQPGDAIVVVTSDVHLRQTYETFDWYYEGAPTCEVYEDKLDDPQVIAGLNSCLIGHERAWVVGLRWLGDYEGLSARGLSSDLHEVFVDESGGAWRLVEAHEGSEFYLLGAYLYERVPVSTGD